MEVDQVQWNLTVMAVEAKVMWKYYDTDQWRLFHNEIHILQKIFLRKGGRLKIISD